MKNSGRPKGATREAVTLRNAMKRSVFELSKRAAGGDADAQELLMSLAVRDDRFRNILVGAISA